MKSFISTRLHLLLFGLILLLSAAPLAAVDVIPGEWRFLGPEGGPILDLVAAPGNPRVLYANASGTLHRSLDGGATWARGSDATYDMAVDALDPFLVYVVRPPQLVRSLDGGGTWQSLDTPAWPVNQIVAHPRFARTVFAATEEGLFQSTNAGLTWKLLQQGGLPADYRANRLVIDPVSPRRLYLALDDLAAGEPRLFKSLDGGASWRRIDSGPLAGMPVVALATRPRSSRILYAATFNDVYKSLDGGRSWTAIGHEGGVPGGTRLLAVQPDRPNVVYAGGDEGLFRSEDAGATWGPLPGLPFQPVVTALLVLPRRLFAGVIPFGHPSGLFKSSDGGLSWTPSNRGIHALTVLSIRVGEPGTLWILADNVLFRSTNQGLTWTPVRPDPDRFHLPVAVAVDPADRSNVFVLFGNGPLWRTGDAGQTWQLAGNVGLQAFDIEIDPQNPSTLYAAGYEGIAKSTDRGATWTRLPVENAAFYYDLDIAPSSPSTLYAGGIHEGFSPFYLGSRDGGATWTRLSLAAQDRTLPNLAVDPLVATTVYTADGGHVLRSTDAGETWDIVSETIDAESIHPVETSPSGRRLYAAVWNEGVFALEEGDAAWAVLGVRRFPQIFKALVVDPNNPCQVYAAAEATSLLVFTHSGTAECP